MLESQSEVPLYQQISNDIQGKIKSGIYKEGQMLPSESKFCEIYNVSRVTVRSAIADLVDRELVVRKHGKGTFVTKKKIDSSLFHFEGFTTACKRNHVSTKTHVLKLEEQKASTKDIRLLQLNEGDTVIYLQRLRFANNIPVIIEHVCLPKKQYGFLLEEDLENKSLYSVLAEHTGINPEDNCNVSITIETSAATSEEARLLNIKNGMPLFVLKETIFSRDTGMPVHHTKQIMSGNYFIFTLTNENNQLSLNMN